MNSARRAAAAGFAHERALAAVPLPDGPPDLGGDMAPWGRRTPLTRTRPCGGGELAALELTNERIERPLEDLGEVTRGDLVAEQRLGVAQLVVSVPAQGELDRERVRPQRFDPGAIARMARGEHRLNMPRGMLPQQWCPRMRRRMPRLLSDRFWNEWGSPLNMPRGMLLGGRDRLHPGQHVWPREPLRHQQLDLGLGLVRGRRQEFVGRVLSEVGRQQDHRTQM